MGPFILIMYGHSYVPLTTSHRVPFRLRRVISYQNFIKPVEEKIKLLAKLLHPSLFSFGKEGWEGRREKKKGGGRKGGKDVQIDL